MLRCWLLPGGWLRRWQSRRRLLSVGLGEHGDFGGPGGQKEETYVGGGFESEPVDWMRVCLTRRGEKHHAAGAAVVILGHGYAEDVAVASASIAWTAGRRRVRRVEAIIAVDIISSVQSSLFVCTVFGLPGTTSNIKRTIGDGSIENGQIIVWANQWAKCWEDGTACGLKEAGHELRGIAVGEGCIGHRSRLIEPYLVCCRHQHGYMALGT